jgi:precorrin-6Y C5,15-methyltransferase (decarboxylating)
MSAPQTSPWLSIVGIGEDGANGLSPAARALIDQAEILAGGERHLAMLPGTTAERLAWTTPFADAIGRLQALRGRRVCVLASGDPMWFGIGATLAALFPPDEMTVAPHPGAFSLAAARMGWPLQEVACLSVHGRPLEAVELHLQPRNRLLILSHDRGSPARLAALLTGRGFGASRLTVLARLGGPGERRIAGIAAAWPDAEPDDLNTIAVELPASGPFLGRVPGLPDDAFLHDGQMTKREVRAVTLSALAPWPGAVLWDVGAGCGSIAVEWARAGGRAVAVECAAERRAMIAHNALRLGVPGLQVVAGRAPGALAGLEGRPDAVFVGGGVSQPGMLQAAWDALPTGGRLVANAVTAEAEAALLDWQRRHGGELVRLEVSRLAPTGRLHSWHPLRPVTQYCGVKS